jgi:hypothetical protein
MPRSRSQVADSEIRLAPQHSRNDPVVVVIAQGTDHVLDVRAHSGMLAEKDSPIGFEVQLCSIVSEILIRTEARREALIRFKKWSAT